MSDMTPAPVPQGTAAHRYSGLTFDREPFLTRARDMSKLTLPFLFREEGDNGTTPAELGWSSFGGYAVATLAAKVIFSFFPPHKPPMRLTPSRSVMMDIGKLPDPEQRASLTNIITAGLSKEEREFVSAFEEDGDRAILSVTALKLVVGGNHGFQFYPDGTLRGIPLDHFVAVRDPSGSVLEFVIQDMLAWETLPEDIRVTAQTKGYRVAPPGQKNQAIGVYTHGCLEDGMWTVYQEVYGEEVAGSRKKYLPEALSYYFIPWMLLDGEDYGRSYAEYFEADFQTVEGLTQSITEGAAAMARFITLVHPGGYTNRSNYAKAANGAVISGRTEDVAVVQSNKAMDFQVAKAEKDDAQQRLSRAFLLFSAVQRDGERVTAEEIRRVAGELEEALGGVYSQQAVSFQGPYLRGKVMRLQQSKRMTPLPKNSVKVTLLGGLAALGRTSEMSDLDEWLGGALNVFGPQAVAGALGPKAIRTYLMRRAAALSVDTDGLIPSEEEAAQLQAQQTQMAMMQQLGPEALKQVGSNLTANQVADTNAQAKVATAGPQAQQALPAPSTAQQ